MTERLHVYIAHRLSSPDRAANIEAAGKLVADLSERLPIVPHCSWIILARYWDEGKRYLGLDIDRAQISRVDELWYTGPEMSSGMQLEGGWATQDRKPTIDMTGMSVDEIVRHLHLYELSRAIPGIP